MRDTRTNRRRPVEFRFAFELLGFSEAASLEGSRASKGRRVGSRRPFSHSGRDPVDASATLHLLGLDIEP